MDICHLALLPYVQVFITEKNLANTIKQAKLKPTTSVFSGICDWQETVED